ncbi:glycosyltransferase family 2 protein [Oleiagrimonas sp. C23AA]|uniref:glycosyltransferase family 2 protein n=1 Tax=Oleiagrimonas sp. C23AA TaxID=2719047 RepID=UPI00141DC32E|nr:glycosyltransferase family 2 protein [Oleiagrimonas sp. C23AA]NII10882.1 glycosyltransferase family 2 protein [Oleiagrimonas sp. C23AA]
MNTEPDYCCILIPCLNEAKAIGPLLDSLKPLGLPIIVVDDGSDDGTPEMVRERGVTLIQHAQRSGKGEALRTGFREALERGYQAALTMDGDGQHIAADVPRILAVARRYPNHIVTGARLINRHKQPNYRRRANNFADWGISWACGQRLIDTQSGQRYYPKAVLELHGIQTQGFVFESEILIEAAWQCGVRVASVPIESRYEHTQVDGPRQFRVSHFKPVPDFLRITFHVIGKIVGAGFLLDNYRRVRREKPLLIDPGKDTGSTTDEAEAHARA